MRIKKLKVRPRKLEKVGPCTAELATLLTCWTNNNVDSPKCSQSAKSLSECMRAAAIKGSKPPNTINYHLGRLGKLL